VATEAAWLHGNNLEKEEIKKKKEKRKNIREVLVLTLGARGLRACGEAYPLAEITPVSMCAKGINPAFCRVRRDGTFVVLQRAQGTEPSS
jgi:hypothetical protein